MPPPTNSHNEAASQGSPRKATKSCLKTQTSIDGPDEGAEADKSGPKEDADTNAPATATHMNVSGALQRKMSELQASGWRPPEESFDSDDDYDGVDMISNSDDEEKSMRKAEEKLMAQDEDDDDEHNAALARRLSLSSQNSNQGELAYLEFNDDYLLRDDPFSQPWLDADEIVAAPEFFREASPLTRTESEQTVPPQRRVRFEERADMSDETDSDNDSDFFPDLFIQQDHLDPRFRRLIEKDDDHELYQDDSSNAGSEWDFEADEMRMLLMDEEEEESDSSAGSSGYECMFWPLRQDSSTSKLTLSSPKPMTVTQPMKNPCLPRQREPLPPLQARVIPSPLLALLLQAPLASNWPFARTRTSAPLHNPRWELSSSTLTALFSPSMVLVSRKRAPCGQQRSNPLPTSSCGIVCIC
jgi:hypothetical protein